MIDYDESGSISTDDSLKSKNTRSLTFTLAIKTCVIYSILVLEFLSIFRYVLFNFFYKMEDDIPLNSYTKIW